MSGSSNGTNNSYCSSDSTSRVQVSPSSESEECKNVHLLDDQSPRSTSSSTSGSSTTTNSDNMSRNTSMHAILSCIPEGTESDVSPDSSEVLSTAAFKRTLYNNMRTNARRRNNLSKMTNRSYISSDSESSSISNQYNREPTNNQAMSSSSAIQMYPTPSPRIIHLPGQLLTSLFLISIHMHTTFCNKSTTTAFYNHVYS